MQETQGKNKVQTLFDVFQIPTDNHIRTLLDAVEPQAVYPMFDFIFEGFQQAGVIDAFRSADNRLLLALDGTQYFSSQKLHGACCSCKTYSNGKVSYSHTVVTPVLVKPGNDKVISLAPEFVCPQEAQEKQDCEINASLRWLEAQGSQYAELGTTVLGDDLYCHEPFCRALSSKGFDKFWSANLILIRRCTNGLMIWSVMVLLKQWNTNVGQENGMKQTLTVM